MSGVEPEVFISYAHEDADLTKEIHAALEASGIRCWMDHRDIREGFEWQEAIVRALRQARLALLVHSAAANDSREVAREIHLAAKWQRVVLPVRVERVEYSDALIYYLNDIQYLNLLSTDRSEWLPRVADTVARILVEARTPAGSPTPVTPSVITRTIGVHAASPGVPTPRPPGEQMVTRTVRVDREPNAIAPAPGGIWVASGGKHLELIDPETLEVRAELDVPGIDAIAGAGETLWVSTADGALIAVDSGGTARGRIELAVTGSLDADPDAAWVGGDDECTLVRVDASTMAVTGRIDLGAPVHSVTCGAGAVWLADERAQVLTRVDAESCEVTGQTFVGAGVQSIAAGHGSVWAADFEDGVVRRFDAATGSAAGSVAVGHNPVAILCGTKEVWVLSRVRRVVARIDPATLQCTEQVRVGRGACSMMTAHRAVWVASSRDATLTEVSW